MKFALNVGKKITQTLKNARMKQNVSIAKVCMHQMIKNVQIEEEKEIQRIKAERGISYTMDIFNSVTTTYAQAVATTNLC